MAWKAVHFRLQPLAKAEAGSSVSHCNTRLTQQINTAFSGWKSKERWLHECSLHILRCKFYWLFSSKHWKAWEDGRLGHREKVMHDLGACLCFKSVNRFWQKEFWQKAKELVKLSTSNDEFSAFGWQQYPSDWQSWARDAQNRKISGFQLQVERSIPKKSVKLFTQGWFHTRQICTLSCMVRILPWSEFNSHTG